MTKACPITLADKEFLVPALPLRINQVVYPLVRKLMMADLIERCINAHGELVATDEEQADLIEIIWLSAKAAQPDLERDAFFDLAITPPQMLDALFTIRYQTGAWVPADPATLTSEEPEGEQQGA